IKRNALRFPCPVQEWLAQRFQPVRCPLCFFDGCSIQYFLNQGFGFFACEILPVPLKRWSKGGVVAVCLGRFLLAKLCLGSYVRTKDGFSGWMLVTFGLLGRLSRSVASPRHRPPPPLSTVKAS